MAINLGFQKVHTDGLVFGYDVYDIYNSFKGEPTTNLIPNSENLNQLNLKQQIVVTSSVASHKLSGNTIVFDKIVSTSASDPFCGHTVSGLGNISSRTFAFSVWLYTDSGQPVSGQMYMYGSTAIEEVKSTNITITNVPTRYVLIGTFTAGRTSTGVVVRFDLPTSGISFWYAGGMQLEEKDHATQYLRTDGASTSRSSTQSLFDYVTNTPLSVANVNFDSNALPFFNGTDSINLGSLLDTKILGAYGTVECLFYSTNAPSTGYIFRSVGTNSNRFYLNFSSNSISVTRSNPAIGISTGASINNWYHIVFTWNDTTLFLYTNGVLRGSNSYVNASTNGLETRIGSFDSNDSQSIIGYIPMFKLYQKVFTQDIVTNNFSLYKSRYNL